MRRTMIALKGKDWKKAMDVVFCEIEEAAEMTLNNQIGYYHQGTVGFDGRSLWRLTLEEVFNIKADDKELPWNYISEWIDFFLTEEEHPDIIQEYLSHSIWRYFRQGVYEHPRDTWEYSI